MNETPRLRSAFPTTPRTDPRARNLNLNGRPGPGSSPLFPQKPSPVVKQPVKISPEAVATSAPLIPIDIIDVPQQRFYVFAFYIALTAWRLYNSFSVESDLDSTWLFLKWVGIDAAFFVALPAFKIPWLEFSFLTTFTLWLLHAIANAFLMYKIPIPMLTWLGALVKVAYDRELSLSEHRVKPADILQNSSIILGKQIIHILPEGSAILNPEKKSFCLDPSNPAADLPIQINQTTPISIELQRYDLDTDEVETITIGSKQAKQLLKKANAGHHKSDTNTPRILHYPVSKKGLYQLHRVIDATKLEVRRRSFDVAVVQCPEASISAELEDRCTGELSNVSLKVSGVPPFKVRYSKTVNHKQFSSIVQNVQPHVDPDLVADDESAGVVLDPRRPHIGWTKSTTESFEINESLHQNGSHSYTVEEVEDGLGNKVNYDASNPKHAHAPRVQSLTVHNRPRITLGGLHVDRVLRAPEGRAINLPIHIPQPDSLHSSDWPLKVSYSFISEEGQEDSQPEHHTYDMANSHSTPLITVPGRYSLDSIGSQYCHGEVAEPSSLLLSNPPKPGLSLEKEDIFDKCAGNPIGMYLNFDFTGSPPFKVRYVVTHQGRAHGKVEEFPGMRGRIELRERAAGSYTYRFRDIEDQVYGVVPLKDQNLVLQQDIRPPASASFHGDGRAIKACLGSPVSVPVRLSGHGPWNLDYEVVHAGKRKKYSISSEEELYNIELSPFTNGGSYSIVLMGVQDQSKCRTTLQEERKIEVRPEQPRAAFGDIEGKRSILALDGKSVKLPLRLQGIAPWAVRLQNLDQESDSFEQIFKDANGELSVNRPGTYEIVSVHDSCPGVVDTKANKFEVSWIARPTLAIKDSAVDKGSVRSFRKPAVCQGDEATLALALSGSAPFHVKYQQKFEPIKGPSAISNKPATFAGVNAQINLDTSRAGEYTYVFSELSDARYSHDNKAFTPTIVKQQVYAPPSAAFGQAGKTYGYCKDDPSFTASVEAETEQIPIKFTGTPPFSVEIAITHHGVSTRPEIIRQKDIQTNTYSWPLSRATLDLGTHAISIRSVKDGRGCESILDSDPSSVRVHVSSPPTIIPLESQEHYCVGEHVSFSLSGQAPFDIFYSFNARERKARVSGTEFRRLAESPGEFIITGVSDSAMGHSKCRARKDIRKQIHAFPSVEIAQGRTVVSDIHEGGEVDIEFRFTGTPPFEFTYTRSENPVRGKKGSKPRILETRHDTSDEFRKMIRASDEGIYEVVSIKDRFCSYTKPSHKLSSGGGGLLGGAGQKRLTY
ncbi:Nucleoporin pom152 [Cladophialophora carrionii]|uniref:Nucleoporin pom152 n=1 Tax=Cladophialophora carrionii TaxID=86049 RepID=A0A1C1CGP7_9EURO|nr:Nucleoporin pom152 [Cladophialophora carrionii]